MLKVVHQQGTKGELSPPINNIPSTIYIANVTT